MKSYYDEFKSIVLNHLSETLPESDWLYFREIARHGKSPEPDAARARKVKTREDLVNVALTEDVMPFAILLETFQKTAVEINRIDGQPVFYLGNGAYVWAPSHDAGVHLSIWATCPAYPLGW